MLGETTRALFWLPESLYWSTQWIWRRLRNKQRLDLWLVELEDSESTLREELKDFITDILLIIVGIVFGMWLIPLYPTKSTFAVVVYLLGIVTFPPGMLIKFSMPRISRPWLATAVAMEGIPALLTGMLISALF